VGTRVFTAVQIGPGAHPASCKMDTEFLSRGESVDHPPPPKTTLKKEYSYTSTPVLGLHGLLQGEIHLSSCAISDVYLFVLSFVCLFFGLFVRSFAYLFNDAHSTTGLCVIYGRTVGCSVINELDRMRKELVMLRTM
jgi:hypothetical protein